MTKQLEIYKKELGQFFYLIFSLNELYLSCKLYKYATESEYVTHITYVLQTLPSKVPSVDLVRTELSRWSKNFVDIETLRSKAESASTEMHTLKEKIVLLEKRVQVSSLNNSKHHW